MPITIQEQTPHSYTQQEVDAACRNHDLLTSYKKDWNKFAKDILRCTLDKDQQAILYSIQTNPRTSVRSGHARGKDFVSAVAAICFLYLNHVCKVIMTAPTSRQAIKIMMSEVGRVLGGANRYLKDKGIAGGMGGERQATGIVFPEQPEKYMLAFTAKENETENWTGFHSENIMVIVTEASGISQTTFEAIEGLLTGDSRFLIVFNPNRSEGEAYTSTYDARYKSFQLDCRFSPNVLAKKIVVPGQVDWDWVNDKVHAPGWCDKITKAEMKEEYNDFEWEGEYFRPSDLFRPKVMGEFPKQDEDSLIPKAWYWAAVERYAKIKIKKNWRKDEDLLIGVDVAGMGVDRTVLCYRTDKVLYAFDVRTKQRHMRTVGHVKTILDKNENHCAFIDTIGEGAGVHSRLEEQELNSVSVKFSEGASDITDLTGEREFGNMRAYCYWAVRDALDPAFKSKFALPDDPELLQELVETRWEVRSNGKIYIEAKEKIKLRLGRSPDKADALALSFYPYGGGIGDSIGFI